MRRALLLIFVVGCYRDGAAPDAPRTTGRPPAPSSLVGAARPPSYEEVQAVAISRLIPESDWPQLQGRVVGVVFAAGPQQWGASINNLRGFDTLPDSEIYRFSTEGASSYGLYWRAKRGGQSFDRRQLCTAGGPVASTTYKPGDENQYGVARRAMLVELEVNGGRGTCGTDLLVSGATILDRTDAAHFDTEDVLRQLRGRFNETVTAHASDLSAAMLEQHKRLENEKRERVIGAMPTWLAAERQLEVLFIVRDEHSGTTYGYGAMSSSDRTLFARPAPPEPILFAHGAAMAVRYTVDHTGKLVGETVYLPASYTAHRGRDYGRAEDDWYGR